MNMSSDQGGNCQVEHMNSLSWLADYKLTFTFLRDGIVSCQYVHSWLRLPQLAAVTNSSQITGFIANSLYSIWGH